ncbi:CO dehydrogenase/acetyl-CoA synthase beta subunit-like protein [Desulfitobacterium hafniense DCB-2]|uniref:CO-methylating acetyl-CoA synthase n=1 Tax=Desulfitobacterium hafniense (strain DSM 10664 / DCB-2) TaxID=272564 RepID=B8FZT4_DESHD|nr:hypothetical protein [Desulfitobacterium hafniense]ACL19158.1 CO dehydrogenase/acetyl-CoA synthase beta subunit-like protein [Desulfitobacterium hafniense DCB-2]
MAVFSQYFGKLNQYKNALTQKVDNYWTLSCFQDVAAINPWLVPGQGRKTGSSIVLKNDVLVELGSPEAGSCSMTLYTNSPHQITDGWITLMGSDITEYTPKKLPFGQVIMVGGEHLTEEDYYYLLQNLNVSEMIEGYMIRSTAESIWCRISKDAAKNGFNFHVLGSVLNWHIKQILPKVKAVEIVFVTTTKEDIEELNQISKEVGEIGRRIKERIWREKGVDIYKCVPGGHCGACEDKTVCDTIRKIGAGR